MPSLDSPYVAYAKQAATNAGVPPEIMLGLITQENAAWNPSLTNKNANGTTDVGLTQLNSAYYPTAGSMTPQQQIDTTASTLAANYKATGNWYDAVRKYNGSGAATYSYASGVFNNAAAYGYTATDVTTAANTGLSLDPTAILNGTGGVTGTSADGSVSVTIPSTTTTSPTSGLGGDGTTAPTTTPTSDLGSTISAWASGPHLNLILIVVAALIILMAMFATMNSHDQPITVQAKI